MRKKILLLMGLFCVAVSAKTESKNIFPQGTFDLNPQRFWSGTKQYLTIDTSVYKEGAASAKIVTTDIGKPGYIYSYCPMKEGKTYKISLWYKTMDLVPGPEKLSIRLAFNLEGKGNGSAGAKVITFPQGSSTSEWQELVETVVPPQGTVTCQFVLGFGGTVGTIWIDDIRIVEEEEITTRVSISKALLPPVIDGRDDDSCWKDAEIADGFRIADYGGNLAKKQTVVKTSYDAKNLYFFIKCEEPEVKKLIAQEKGRDNPNVWKDDCVELFISPGYEKTFHFIINSIGTLYDSEIAVNDQSATGITRKNEWNSDARVSTFIGKDYWTVELAIPFVSLTKEAIDKVSWRVNFAREEQSIGELSTWSRIIGAFYQPKFFSQMVFEGTGAFFTRSMGVLFLDPLVVERSKPLYEQLLINTPGKYTSYMWDNTIWKPNLPKAVQDRFNDEEWKNEVLDMIKRKSESGISGTALPWAVDKRTFDRSEEYCIEDWEKYGLRRKYCTESSASIRIALEKGAEHLHNDPTRRSTLVSWIDPAYVTGVIEEIEQALTRFKDKPYLWSIEGRDEPNIWPVQGKISEMGPKMKAWYDEVLTKYGFGKYPMPAPNDPSYWTHRETHPFSRIAFARWASDSYASTKEEMYNALKKISPDIPYQGNSFWLMSGFLPWDYSLFSRYTDWVAGDPYASSAERREGRGIYNHGFGTKLLRDLSGKPTTTIVQCFSYAGYTPKPENLREWVSQALKTGASRIEFYEAGERYGNPILYEEMLRVAKIVTTMKRVNIPTDPDTAILISLDTEAALEANGDHIYTAYSILGETIGAWFDFISERQLERNEKSLGGYKIIYLPLGKYLSREATEKLFEYVQGGGILVIGDPESFSYHRDGSSLMKYRENLTGARIGEKSFPVETITIIGIEELKGQQYHISKKDGMYNAIHTGHELVLLSTRTKVLAKFPEGTPALLENPVGKGKVIYFAANPFAPDLLSIKSKVSEFFRVIQKDANTKIGRPIWNFLLPEK